MLQAMDIVGQVSPNLSTAGQLRLMQWVCGYQQTLRGLGVQEVRPGHQCFEVHCARLQDCAFTITVTVLGTAKPCTATHKGARGSWGTHVHIWAVQNSAAALLGATWESLHSPGWMSFR